MGSGKPLLDEISVLASMDLLYTCTLYPPAIGGAQIHLHSLTRQLRVLGNQVQVITSCTWNRTDWLRLSTVAPEERRDTEHEGILVRQVGYSWGYRARMFPWALAYYALMSRSVRNISRLIREVAPWPEKTPSLVHASRVGREFLTRASLDYARHRGIPFVLTPNHHPRWHGYLYREYDKIYREADAVIALTEAERDQLIAQKRVRPERVHVTGIGPVLSEDFSAEKFRSDFGVPGRFVLYLGQQFKYKGIGQLVEAAPEVWRRHPDVCFVFVGPRSSYSEKLFSRVRDPRLINLGSVDLPTKTSAIAASAFLCLPSSQESFGGVFVEAWSHRKAVIGGRIPPIASVIDDGRDGLLVDQSPVELAQAIDRLLSDGDESSAMGQAGWEKVQSRYTWEMLARRTLSIYEACGTGHAFPGEASRSCGGGGAALGPVAEVRT